MAQKALAFTNVFKWCTVNFMSHIPRRYVSKLTFTQRCRDFLNPGFPKPPYSFISQIGEPLLRQKCDLVDEGLINTRSFQDLILHMWELHKSHKLAGLAAPQIGLPLQLAVIGFSLDLTKELNSKVVAPVPYRVLINPIIKVLDYKNKITDSEGCASVCGYTAQVSRYARIQVEALNEKGVKETWEPNIHEARVIQHEVDHLEGVIFVDRMEARTLECSCWQHVKLHHGQGFITFTPGKRTLSSKLSKLFSS